MGKEFDIDLSGIKKGIMDELAEVVADAYAEGAKEGAKKGTKKLEKELEETKVKLNTVIAEVEDIAVVIDDEKTQKKLKTVAQKAVGKKPVGVRVEVEPEIDVSKYTLLRNAEKKIKKSSGELEKQVRNAYLGMADGKPKSSEKFVGHYTTLKESGVDYSNTLLKEIPDLDESFESLIKHEERLKRIHEETTLKIKSELDLINQVRNAKTEAAKVDLTTPSYQSGVLLGDADGIKREIAQLENEVKADSGTGLIQSILFGEDGHIKMPSTILKEIDDIQKEIDARLSKNVHADITDLVDNKSKLITTSVLNGLLSFDDISKYMDHPDYIYSEADRLGLNNISSQYENIDDTVTSLSNLIEKVKELNSLQAKTSTPDKTEVLSDDAKPVQEVTTAVNEQANAVDNLRKMYDELHVAYDALPKRKTEQPEDYVYDWRNAKDYVKFAYDGEDMLSNDPVFEHDAWEKEYTERLATIREAIQLTYKQIKEMQTAVDKHGGHLGDEVYNERNIKEAKQGLMGLFEMYAANGGDLDLLDVKMTKPFKAMIEIVKESMAVNAAQKEQYDAETKEIIENNLEQIKSYEKLHQAIQEAFDAAKSKEKGYEYKDAHFKLPWLHTGYDYDDYSAFDENESFEYICKYLGIEIPQAAEKAEQAIKEATNVPLPDVNQTPLLSDDKNLDNIPRLATSAEESVPAINEESEAAEKVAKNMEKAATAKEEFAKANKKVKESADASTPALESEAEAFTVVPMTDEWNKAVKAAEDYMSILGEVYNVTRKIRTDKDGNRLISYQLTGETGNSITVGENGGLVSSTEKISDALDKARQTEKVLSDWDEAIQINDKLDKAKKDEEALIRATQDAIEYEERENAYKEQRKKYLAEGKQQEIDYNNATNQNNDAVKAYEKLYEKADKYYTLLAKQKANQELTNKESKELEVLTKEFYKASEGVGEYAKALDNLGSKESRNKYDNIRSSFIQDSSKSYLDNLKVDIDKSADKFVLGTANKRALEFVDEYKAKVKELEVAIGNLKGLQDKGIDLVSSKELGDVATLLVQVEQLEAELRRMKNNKEYYIDLSEAWDKVGKISQTLEKNTKMPKELREQFEALQKKYEIVIETKGSQKQIEELNVDLAKLNAELQASGKTGRSFFDLVGTKMHHLAAQFFAMYLSFQDLLQIMRRGFEVIKEYDKALTEMNKVSNESISTLKKFQQESFALADSIGATASAIQNSTADFMKLGYELDEASELAEWSNIYANVGDMGIDEATEHMISSIKAWSSEFANDIEASEAIVNRYNEIGNNYAITSADIGSAMERSAAALKAGGNTLDESLGMLVAGNLIQQDADTTANALKVLSLRIRGAKADLEDMGESTDDLVSSTSKMREQIQALTGVDIMLDENTFKSTAEIITEIGEVWADLTDVSQAATLELLAGKNRASTVSGLIENYEIIEDVMKTAEESQGSALEENQRYIESIEGSLNQLKNAWDKLWVNENNREVITFFLDLAKSILEVVDKVGVLNTAFIGLGGFFGAKMAKSGGRAKCCPSKEYATGEFSSDVYELRVV